MSSRLENLRAAADLAWESALAAPADKRAPLIAQYRVLLADIDALDDGSKAGDPIDELANRRSARRSGAAAGEGHAARGPR
jgi:hypothetical protein